MSFEETNLPKKCVCSYCTQYEHPYAHLYNSQWLTISPPRRDKKAQVLFDNDRWDFLKNIKNMAKDFIIVAEVANFRIHYHILYNLCNPVYQFKYFGGLEYTLRFQYRNYPGLPKGGFHYLFKDIELTQQFGIKQPVLTDKDFCHPCPSSSISITSAKIPTWMTHSDKDSQSESVSDGECVNSDCFMSANK